jgi:histidinol-phosphate phosphatase family protein
MSNRAVFLDRDGTMAKDVHYCRRPEDFQLFPDTAKAIRLLNKHGFKVIIITNQSGIARGYFTGEILSEIHRKMKEELAREGARVDAIYYCPHHPDDNCLCRKPKPALLFQAAKKYNIDLTQSYVLGDLMIDVGLGKAGGCRTVLIDANRQVDEDLKPDAIVPDILKGVKAILVMEKGE